MVDAFNWCAKQTKPIKAAEFILDLERIDDAPNPPDNSTRKRTIPTIGELDTMNYGSISHYWFYRLDYELWKLFLMDSTGCIWSNLQKTENSKKVKRLVESFRFRKCGSVEHIIPQKNIDGSSKEQPDHTFGNLALISSSRNSKFSNNPMSGKREIILSSEYTESLKMLHFLWCDSNSESHGKAMFQILESTEKR